MSLRCNAAAAVMSLALASSMPASDAAAGDGFGNQNVFSASLTGMDWCFDRGAWRLGRWGR